MNGRYIGGQAASQSARDMTKGWNGLENGLINELAKVHLKALFYQLFCQHQSDNNKNNITKCGYINHCNDTLKAW